jgi:hypothetical protein
LGTGDVALDALDRQCTADTFRGDRSLIMFAEAIDGGGLADHAEIDRLAGRGQSSRRP